MEDAGIRAYLPLPDFGRRTPFFGKNKFVYDAERDVYVCPQGKDLHRYTIVNRDRVVKYKADPTVCNACPVKSECTASSKGRLVSRSFDEAYLLEMVRAYHLTEPYKKVMRKRKVWVEPMFAEAKCWHGLRRFRLRRLERVNIEALLTAAGQNLKRLLTFGKRRPKAPVQAAALCSATIVDHEIHHAREHRTTLSWWPAAPFLNTPGDYAKFGFFVYINSAILRGLCPAYPCGSDHTSKRPRSLGTPHEQRPARNPQALTPSQRRSLSEG